MLIHDALLLQVSGMDIEYQLRLEEAFLRTSDSSLCLINVAPPPAIVLGISSQPDKVLFTDNIIQDQIPVIRRFSGGGTVLVGPEVIMISWICKSHNGSLISPQQIMDYTKTLYRESFPQGFDVCDNDYVINNQKIGGNAQYIQKDRWVHHSSFLWKVNANLMSRYLRIPQKQPEYRKNRTHQDFTTGLEHFHSDQEAFVENLLYNINLQVRFHLTELEALTPILDFPHRKSTIKIDLISS